MKRNKTLYLLCFFVLFAVSQAPFAAFAQSVCYLWDYDRLCEIRKNPDYQDIVAECVRKADSFVDLQPLTVMDKEWSFNDDFHYYATMAGYWWPEERNGKIYYVNRDGQSNPEVKSLDFGKIKEMAERLQYLSLSYFFTRDRRYLKAYKKQIDVWFIQKDTYMYPNFEYAQVIPGRNDNRGRPVGLIDAHPFNTILESLRLINHERSIGWSRRRAVEAWFAEFADWMVNSEIGKGDRIGNSNSSVSYDATLLNMAVYTGNDDLIKELTDNFSRDRVYVQIEESGKLPKELARTNAFSYSLANLRFMVEFCLISQNLGVDIYSQGKQRFDSAIHYLYTVLQDREHFPYKQDGGWKYADSGFDIIVRRFKRVNNALEEDLGMDRQESPLSSIDELMFL